MNETKVSVVIPIYNVEKYLDRCVNSVINQTYKDLEIILVNDGSPDNCPQMCDEWAQKDNRIKVLHKQNGGLMSAWMAGVNIATGEYIAFIDSDDWVELDFVEELIRPFLNDKDIDLTVCNYYNAYDNYRTIVSVENCEENENLLSQDKLMEIKNHLSVFSYSRWNKMYKRSAILANLKYCNPEISLGEDSCITRACFLDAKKVWFVKKPLYNYYFRTNSIVNSFKPKHISDFIKVNIMLKKLFEDKQCDISKNLSYELQHQMHFILKSIFWSDLKQKRTNYKLVLKSNLIKDYLKCDDGCFIKRQRIIKRIIKTHSYLLMKLFYAVLSKKVKRGTEQKLPY